ncbi:MAG: hypothetical protein IPI42_04870 [Saprospiraceae bacterium]|nr:hypothetical protein [Candidatus Parvibacillus calidus]
MGIATLGAMGIEQYREAVAVMLFNRFGRLSGHLLSKQSKYQDDVGSKTDEVTIVNGDKFETVKVATVPPAPL